jgi:uncharacterized protein YktA (UPF0223 family)
MAKAERPKATTRLSKKAQYERFVETARDLGVDNQESAEAFEKAFKKIVPSRPLPKRS